MKYSIKYICSHQSCCFQRRCEVILTSINSTTMTSSAADPARRADWPSIRKPVDSSASKFPLDFLLWPLITGTSTQVLRTVIEREWTCHVLQMVHRWKWGMAFSCEAHALDTRRLIADHYSAHRAVAISSYGQSLGAAYVLHVQDAGTGAEDRRRYLLA